MQKYPLMAVSIIAGIFLILGSLTNVVGYQTVQSSNQEIIKEEVNQKELLFQTIIDFVNNKEIQKIVSVSEIKRGGFFNRGLSSSVFTPHFLTKKFLNTAYHIGLILMRSLSTSKIPSMLKQYQVNNQGVQKEITAVIEKDAALKEEIMQLSNSTCDCKNDTTSQRGNPFLCLLLTPLLLFTLFLASCINLYLPIQIMMLIGLYLDCFWLQPD